MEYTATKPNLRLSLLQALLGALIARPAAALINATMEVHLYTDRLNPMTTENPTNTDFTEATFDGYTAQGPTAYSISRTPNQSGFEMHTPVFFISTGTTINELIKGYYVVAEGGTDVFLWEDFTNPIPMGVVIGDFLDLDAAFPILFQPIVN